ncbi:MAG: hypothetical protein MZV63_21185 [Marinilabiliales bacterium]|nr:hypothetical protein [Marinilabiliales bacterium]
MPSVSEDGMGNVARRPASSLIIPNQWSLNAGSQPQRVMLPWSDSITYSWKLSGKPRYLEGARYWLQYAGMPDTLVYTRNRGRTTTTTITCRVPSGSTTCCANLTATGGMTGLGIPVDLSLAFHTDAGVTPDDSIIGTLGIYSTLSSEGLFPDGTSRLASRDLTDICTDTDR